MSVFFTNNGMDDINFSKVFQNQKFTTCLPETLQNSGNFPCNTYKLYAPIRSKIFNCKNTVEAMCIYKNFRLDINSCECKNSQFCDPHRSHIITGDFRIIENLKFRKLFIKGPNFRPSIAVHYDKCK